LRAQVSPSALEDDLCWFDRMPPELRKKEEKKVSNAPGRTAPILKKKEDDCTIKSAHRQVMAK
jgi:hypothetical protein